MEYFIYDRFNVTVLGTNGEAEGPEGMDSKGNRCFNCGSPQHIVTNCSEPLNRPLIALSRAMYEFFKDPGKGEPERLHEYEERKVKRLRLTESFHAGSICGELREALGMDTADSNGGEKPELPWLWRMLEWGYPPGWISEEDPKHKILARIEGEGMWTDDLNATIIFDNPPQTSSIEDLDASTHNCTDPETCKTLTLPEQTNSQKRWVHYPTTLFSSEHLAAYSGTPLPPLTYSNLRAGSVAVRKEQVVPPWRRPGAFSAFGPTGWQEYIGQQNISMQVPRPDFSARNYSSDDVEESDMDLSE